RPKDGEAPGLSGGLSTHPRRVHSPLHRAEPHFHAVRLGNRAIDQVRRRVQNQTLGHRGRKADPLYRIRRLLLTGAERLTERGSERLLAGLAAGHPDGEVGAAYLAKELLRAVYSAQGIEEARERLGEFSAWCREADVPELATLVGTIRRWEPQVLAYHTTGMSNGPTEAVNLLIENIRRTGYGMRNFANYRLRLLLRCGITWHTPAVARIRGRQPRLIA
ncbi:MAG: ISL3 family transposase, partial [bacterium]